MLQPGDFGLCGREAALDLRKVQRQVQPEQHCGGLIAQGRAALGKIAGHTTGFGFIDRKRRAQHFLQIGD